MAKHVYQITSVQDLRNFLTSLAKADIYPMTLTVDDQPSNRRSTKQNQLQRMWLNELEQQGDMRAEEYRAYCKLHIGVPILRNECEDFKTKYDAVFRPLDYTTKIELMKIPFDFPVTRLMSKKQKTQYLDAVYQHWTSQGIQLTRPDDLMYAGEFE